METPLLCHLTEHLGGPGRCASEITPESTSDRLEGSGDIGTFLDLAPARAVFRTAKPIASSDVLPHPPTMFPLL